ncbi:MAG TPA: hypothetical protein VLT87_26730 [Thermoanaerobaculia bacterium]|nr:hypothetical protein [Thermoanaerobaculia bacterium]
MTRCDRFETEGVLRLEQGLPLDEHYDTCPDCAAAREAHEHLRAGIAGLGADDEPPPGWQARVWERIEERKERRKRHGGWFLWMVPAAVAASLAAFLLLRPTPPPPPSLLARIEAGDTVRRGEEAQPGDLLRLTATTGEAPYAELRVYRNDAEMVLRCSTAAPCTRQGVHLTATLGLDGVGRYTPLLLYSEKPLPEGGGDLDTDTREALNAGAEVELGADVDVR